MSLKVAVKNIVAKNAYVNDAFYKVFAHRNAEDMTAVMRETARFDCIEDPSDLIAFRKKISGGAAFSNKNANLSVSRVYGIWRSLFPGVAEEDSLFTPSVEHGLILHDQVFPDIAHSGRCSVLTMSPWRKDIIKKHRNVPVFCCGPYIQYAEPWYSDQDRNRIKKSLGKTLLVFPCHSTDSSSLSMDNRRYLEIVHEMAKDYDSVLVNAFWWNINDPIMDDFREASYKVVSAGFRDDTNFLRRLRTIISLADFVVGDSVGTHIGYCVELDKPFCLVDAGTKEKLLSSEETTDLEFRAVCVEEIASAFSGASSIGEVQKAVASKYWGYGIRLDEAQLATIKKFTRDLTLMTWGFPAFACKRAIRLIEKGEYDIGSKQMLLDSLDAV